MSYRRFRDWMRVISPSEYLVVIVLVLAGIIATVGAIRSILGEREAWESSLALLVLLVSISTLMYALLRAFHFHPVENRPYGRWLAETPWRHPQDLPLGPVTLVWQDAVVIGVLTALFPPLIVPRLAVPIIFVLVYALILAATECRVGVTWPIYAALALLGCSVLALPIAWIQIPLAGMAYAAAYMGMQEVLQRFPFSSAERKVYLPSERDRLSRMSLVAGWPMPPGRIEKWTWSISHVHAALVGATVGWLFFCFGYHAQDVPGFEIGMRNVVKSIVLISVALRIVIYVAGYVPPISVLGRIATGRLIIPGYDSVLLAPLVILALAWLMMLAAKSAGIPLILFAPVTAGTAVWLTLALPPRQETWHLTGHHRIAYRFRAALLEQGAASKRQQ